LGSHKRVSGYQTILYAWHMYLECVCWWVCRKYALL